MIRDRTLRIWLLGVALTLASLVGGAAALAQSKGPPVVVPLLLCPWGCGPTEGDTILMNQMVRAGSRVTLLPQETPGYIYNIREMVNEKHWKKSVFSTEDVIIQLALKWGGSPELKEFMPEKIPIRFKLLYGEAWWPIGKFLVTFEPSIKKIADLKGKRISIGLRGQSDWGMFPRMFLEHAYGITPQNADIRHLTPTVVTQQLIDGTTDAGVTNFGTEPFLKEIMLPAPIRQLEASGKQMRYLGFDKEVIDKMNAKFGTTWLHAVIPAGTLPKQTEPLSVGINRGYKAVHPDFPEDIAYEIVMAVAKHGPQMKDLHVLWKFWSPELMVAGMSDENTHPGAKRALVELGWWEKTKQYKPMTYPQ